MESKSLTQSLIRNPDAARRIGVSTMTLKRWRDAGRITGIRIGGRIYYRPEAIDSFIQLAGRA